MGIKRRVVTENQRRVAQVLFEGGSIAHLGESIRLLDAGINPVSSISEKTFWQIRHNLKIVKRSKNLGWVLSKTAVRKLHGNSVIKKMYKKHLLKVKGNAKASK